MSDKAKELAKLYKQIDNVHKIIDDLEKDMEEMLQKVEQLRSEGYEENEIEEEEKFI